MINYLNAGFPTEILPSAPIGGGPGFLDTDRERRGRTARFHSDRDQCDECGVGRGRRDSIGLDKHSRPGPPGTVGMDDLLAHVADGEGDLAGQPGRRRRMG